ncbi:uncharacterized protein Z519_00582 [Cladophialophora bantiana CBS 173.52]|uniref:BRCT domain-containing protein n=1 Tax=Cladophialophora bantiana (strain ATCC 10958 / CBS 173.52 / CDC B-1940 / NIH 8579) TaxID=1442370 RepID=A0A0D2IQ70_CLAB1|nr:uncharacterized protein Z519_00582 [Cladophialophora bantiana CBS 173.52]KIW98919.1 hypothetical protein Z519_00582 [Cladophialophora bantiana CBS 173.52]
MAPRKAVSPAKPRRITRARAADADTDTTATANVRETSRRRTTKASSAVPTTSRARALEAKSRVTKKSTTGPASAATKGGRVNTRSAKAVHPVEEDSSDHEDEEVMEVAVAKPPVKPSRTSTRTTANTSVPAAATAGLAAAPRRRIKVTPLVQNESQPEPAAPLPVEEVKPEKKPSKRAKKEKAVPIEAKPSPSRSKRDPALPKPAEDVNTERMQPEPKKRGRGRTAKNELELGEEVPSAPASASTKSRGRLKKGEISAPSVEETKPAPVTTRQTRARAGSTNSSIVTDPPIANAIPKKKVTFEPLPEENDEKENKRPRTMSKSKNTKTQPAAPKKTETAATGMRAKPIRKPANTRTTKAARGAAATKALGSRAKGEVEKNEKIQSRALTPKKITQVAKAMPVDSDDEEDELAGAKTPVRDLSLSPKRGLAASATRLLSPVKKLDFSPALHLTSPPKNDAGGAWGMLSPPRRPASPVKDSLKESPRRAPEGVTIFRAHIPDGQNSAPLILDPSNAQSLLQQSPKRGLTDRIVFPPSAVKSRTTPLKTSLLSSPARRLFSTSKQKTPVQTSPFLGRMSDRESSRPVANAEGRLQSEENDAVAVSSHFRSSLSPQRSARVYRLSEDELAQELGAEVDFDASVLNIRSPLKVDTVKPVVETAVEKMALDDPPVQKNVYQIMEAEFLGVASVDEAVPATRADITETNVDPEVESEDSSNEEEATDAVEPCDIETHDADDCQQADANSVKKPRISDALFSRLRQIDDESEDELAGDQTPDSRFLESHSRPTMSAARIQSRLSTGVVPESASKNLGFTPLAAQVQGWRAASPDKRSGAVSKSRGLFSPVAQMHIAGSVELSRPDTPGREASRRKSMANRFSLAPSIAESPAKADFFAEGMAAQDFQDQVEADAAATARDEDLYNFMPRAIPMDNAAGEIDGEVEATPGEDMGKSSVELTTDLVNFTNASDTAMVDFKALADEAEDLAAQKEHDKEATPDEQANTTIPTLMLETVNEEQSMLSVSTSSRSYGDENTAPIEQPAADDPDTDEMEEFPAEESADCHADVSNDSEEHHGGDDHGTPEHTEGDEAAMDSELGANGQLFEVTAASIDTLPSKHEHTSANVDNAIQEMDFSVTPVRPDPGLPRYVHTAVSKVPLRPEGAVASPPSPLKVQRKRPRSLSSSHVQPVKRRSLGPSLEVPSFDIDPLATPKANSASVTSPQRRMRSAAPSPANSLATGLTTPGRLSFTVEDFGDSTLDGIDLPEEELTSDDVEETEIVDQDDSVLTIGSSLFKTPAAATKRRSIVPSTSQSNVATTPRYATGTKASASRISATPKLTSSRVGASTFKTPTTITKAKTPITSANPKSAAKTLPTSRTPLKTVGNGVLYGAIVHTDIHTSEGMDASAFYIDLLASMGARVVKEWRWNPRASVASSSQEPAGSEAPVSNIGITHVVYKDGGKRTLEKVRSAKGQVLCVGVGWVLDCMREAKWLDESAYAVDASIMPRGGSRRRKSMEPRLLVNDNGFLSANKEHHRRSLSAEYACLTREMKMELINTPVRGMEVVGSVGHTGNGVEVGDESEISSTYNSPTVATVWGGGDTADVGLLMVQQDAETPASALSKKVTTDLSTPKSVSLEVDYDPRTAATPLTPYLVAKGRELVQMSAPPKQINKGIFDRDGDDDDDDDDDDSAAGEKGRANGGKKFQVKMYGKSGRGLLDARRKTLGGGAVGPGFKPRIGSPLKRE